MFNRRMMKAMILPLVAVFALAGCEDGETTGSQQTSLTLLLTDDVGDFEQAWVRIDRIELTGSNEGGHLVLRDEAWEGELLELHNQVATLVEDVVIPEGTYSQVRFIISEGCIEVVSAEDGSGEPTETMVYASSASFDECGSPDGSLQMPSFAQTGIKVNLPGGSMETSGGQKVVLLDFDVAESFGQQAGASGMWVMHPVIHASDFSLSGGIDVLVELEDGVELPAETTLEDFQVELKDEGGDPVGTALDLSSDGEAVFQYRAAGDYTVHLVPPADLTVTTDPADAADSEVGVEVSVVSDQFADVVITILSAEEAGEDEEV